MTRREFVRRETEVLGRFLGADDDHTLIGWRRTYRCGCGFTTGSPGEIFDHRCRLTREPSENPG